MTHGANTSRAGRSLRVFLCVLVLTSYSGCQSTKKFFNEAAIFVFMSPIIILNIAFLPFYLFMDEEEQEENNGVARIDPIPNSDDYLILFRNGKDQHLLRFDFGDRTAVRLTDGDSFDFSPQFNHDGSKLVYVKARGPKKKRGEIIELDLRTSTENILVNTGNTLASPHYVLNSKSIVFIQKRGRYSHLFLYDLNTEKISQLTEGRFGDFSPLPFEDGERVLFSRAHWYGHSSPIAASTWHGYDYYNLDLTSGKYKKLSNEEAYGFIPRRKIAGSDHLLINYKYAVSMDMTGTVDKLYTKFRARLPELKNVEKIHVLPNSNLENAYYVVVKRFVVIASNYEFRSEIYYYDFVDDTVELVATIPEAVYWPKRNEEENELIFKSKDRYKISRFDLDKLEQDGFRFNVEFLEEIK
jgi:hypothetical protein